VYFSVRVDNGRLRGVSNGRRHQQQFRASSDHIAEDALLGCDVLMSAQPPALLVLGNQAMARRSMRASYARALRAPAIAHLGHPGQEARNCSRENIVVQRQHLRGGEWDSETDDPWLGHDKMMRTRVRPRRAMRLLSPRWEDDAAST
jgi:hypothetical protein